MVIEDLSDGPGLDALSTVGAPVVANADDDKRATIYRGLLTWGMAMTITAPFVTWLLFVLPAI